MPIAVELEFDEKSDRFIREIWQEMSEKEVSSFLFHSKSVPHITLGMFDIKKENGEKLVEDIREFCTEISKIEIELSSIGVFKGDKNVLFLAATVTKDLLDLHDRFYEKLKIYRELAWEYYLPDIWVPHVSVAMDVDNDNLYKAMDIVLGKFKKTKATVEKTGIISVKPLKALEHIVLK